ncbi:hypothetical protein CapIbe_019675 [Capra ibex]
MVRMESWECLDRSLGILVTAWPPNGKPRPRVKKSSLEQQDIFKENSSEGIKMEEIAKKKIILGDTWKPI